MCVGLSLGMSTPRIRGMFPSPPLTLPLLVARVAANNVQPPVPPDQFAVLTNAFDAGANFHKHPSLTPRRRRIWQTPIVATGGEATREKIGGTALRRAGGPHAP